MSKPKQATPFIHILNNNLPTLTGSRISVLQRSHFVLLILLETTNKSHIYTVFTVYRARPCCTRYKLVQQFSSIHFSSSVSRKTFSKKKRNSHDFELLSFPNLTIEIAKIASYKLLASWICEQNSENSFEAKHDEAFVSRKNIRYPVVG